ncbi:MAG TPA: helix-turn-helix transcriptional regulator [Acidiferrobacterales bacterium]|nr:helix-turn-helix transcriptional regulator [Acidiferrobacterales bacterium]
MTSEPHRTRQLLARCLRLLRAARGWSQEVLAQLSGLHRTYISSVERTRRNISLDNLEKFAAAFDLTVGDLLAAGCSDPFHVTAHDGRRG